MNFQGKDYFRLLCLGVLLPVALILAALHLGQRETLPPEASDGESTLPTDPQEEEPLLISVLTGGVQQQMELESYLVGVVLAEMPASFGVEALRAQAVAARTYTLRHCRVHPRHGENAVCTDHTCCQAYIDPADYVRAGGSRSSVERVRQAVGDTTGLVLIFEGKLIEATYFSCSGGLTEDAVAVWGQDVPYLQSVPSPGEETASFFTDSKTVSAEDLQSALGVRLTGPVSSWFGDVTFTEGGGVDTVVIGGVAYRGTTVRTLLQLRSTAFSVSFSEDAVTFHTRGYGHRVGMSQYGANAMAAEGKTCGDILAHYYPGTELVQYSLELK